VKQRSLILIAICLLISIPSLWGAAYGQPADDPPDSPLPTPSPTPAVDVTTIALEYVAAQENLPIEELLVVGEEPMTFPTLGLHFIAVTIVYEQPDLFEEYTLLIDPATGTVEPDINGVIAVFRGQGAWCARYGTHVEQLVMEDKKLIVSVQFRQPPPNYACGETGLSAYHLIKVQKRDVALDQVQPVLKSRVVEKAN